MRRFEFEKQSIHVTVILCLAKLMIQVHHDQFGEFPQTLADALDGEFYSDILKSPWKITYQIKDHSYFLYSYGQDDGGYFVPVDNLERTGIGDFVVESQ
jgi:hypothetical protein